MAILTQSIQPVRDRAAGPTGGPVDSDVDIGFGIFNHDVLRTRKIDPNPAAFIFVSARAVFVEKMDRDLAQLVVGPAQRELQAPLDVLAQTIGQRKILGLNVDMHERHSFLD
jgi:hypothetical protein